MYFILFYEVVDDYITRRAPLRREHLALAKRRNESGELLLRGLTTSRRTGRRWFSARTTRGRSRSL